MNSKVSDTEFTIEKTKEEANEKLSSSRLVEGIDSQESREIEKNKKKKKQKKEKKPNETLNAKPGRGVETWFRLTSSNLYTRRGIVDTKANILLTINSLNMSILLGSTYSELDADPYLAAAVVPLITSSLFSIIFTIIAIKPSVGKGKITKDQMKHQCVSLMTFDNFYQMSIDEYRMAVDELLEDSDLLYGSIKTDIHSLGVDLSHRYRYIQRAYSVFLFGIIISALVFLYLKTLL